MDRHWRDAVVSNAGGVCEMRSAGCWGMVCGHHVLGKQAFPQTRHDPGIGVALCERHHGLAHGDPLWFGEWLKVTKHEQWAYCEEMKGKIKRGEV